MDKPILSIYFSENEFKIVECTYIKKEMRVNQCAKGEIPADLIQDSLIFDMEKMAVFLNDFLVTNRFTAKKCHIVIDGNLVLFRNMVIPAVSDDKMRKIITADMIQIIGVPQNYIIDYEIKDLVKEEKIKSYNIVAAAIQKNKVKCCRDLVKDLQMKPLSMNISSSTLERVALSEIGSEDTYIIADRFNENMTTVILSEGKHMLSRSVTLNLSLVSIFNSSDGLANEVTSELSRIMSFYGTSKYGVRPKITHIYLTGDFLNDDNITEDIERELGVETSYMGEDIPDKRIFNEYAVALGAQIIQKGR